MMGAAMQIDQFDPWRAKRSNASIFAGSITYSTTQVITLQPSAALSAAGSFRPDAHPQRHDRALVALPLPAGWLWGG